MIASMIPQKGGGGGGAVVENKSFRFYNSRHLRWVDIAVVARSFEADLAAGKDPE